MKHKYHRHNEAIRRIDAHFRQIGYRRTAIYRKVIAVYFRVGRTMFYNIVATPAAQGTEEDTVVQRLTEIGIEIGVQVLKRKDLI